MKVNTSTAQFIFILVNIAIAVVESNSFISGKADQRKMKFIPFQDFIYVDTYDNDTTQTRLPSPTPIVGANDLTSSPSAPTYVPTFESSVYTSKSTLSPTVDPSTSTSAPSSTHTSSIPLMSQSAEKYVDTNTTSSSMPSLSPIAAQSSMPSSISTLMPTSMPSSMPTSTPSLNKTNPNSLLKATSPSRDYNININNQKDGDNNDDNDTKKPSSIGIGLLSMGGLIVAVFGGAIIVKKKLGQQQNDPVFDDCFPIDNMFDSDSDNEDECYFDKDFDESMGSMGSITVVVH